MCGYLQVYYDKKNHKKWSGFFSNVDIFLHHMSHVPLKMVKFFYTDPE